MGGFLSGKTSLTTVQTADIAANAIDGTLTKDALVGDYSDVTVTAADLIMYGDATDSNNTKRDTVQGILDLVGGAGLTFINTSDISAAATYDFTGFTAASYDTYVLHVMNLIPATDDVSLELLTSTDGGSSFDTGASDYSWYTQMSDSNTGDTADDSIWLNGSTADGTYRFGSASNEDGLSMVLYVVAPHLTKRTQFHWRGSGFNASGAIKLFLGAGARFESADVDGIRLLFTSGNIESGTITAYGLANA